ncbi:hypothetical protein GH714_042738 [Hevea brasiliensis]|uniref:Uncharacterized protein n=1 Tax=Hevea brasiliensis TaxID=3981 RepID=A0A6A6K0A8_HEVBR|nr:hypothetical protein GH714_042738 [Hevea brasiliensis]
MLIEEIASCNVRTKRSTYSRERCCTETSGYSSGSLDMLFITAGSTYANTASNATAADDTATKVICNVIVFVQKLGLPIMTGVILGSSIMAIFGRLAWPAIVMLVVFTAIFFGAGKLMAKFAAGLGSEIGFVQKLGLPIMTGVILGSSIMAIFGKLAWPAIVMLVVFTAIFFGAGKLMAKFAAGINGVGNAESFNCVDGGNASLGGTKQ